MKDKVEAVQKYILYLGVILLPVLVLPVFPDPYSLPKLILLAVILSLLVLTASLGIYVKGRLDFVSGSFDLPVLGLMAAYLLSGILRTPNKMEAFFLPGTAALVIGAGLLYFLANMVLGPNKKGLGVAAFGSGVLLSVATLLAKAGILGKIPALPTYMKDTQFSPANGQLAAAVILGILVPLGIGLVVREKEAVKRILWSVSLAVIVLAFSLSVVALFPGKTTSLAIPDPKTGWAVALEAMKDSPILGNGSGSYVTAFERFRPVSYNSGKLWNMRFTSAGSYFFTLLTETGLLGAAAFIFLTLALYKLLKEKAVSDIWDGASLALAVIALLVLPASIGSLILTFVLLSVASDAKRSIVSLATPVTNSRGSYFSRIPAFLVSVVLLVLVAAFWVEGKSLIAGELKYNDSLNALAKNNAQGTYDAITAAIRANPYVDRYHSLYAQLSLGVAQSLSQKKDITDAEKTDVANLIQTAIAEGKSTVALNPQRAANWTLLADIYRAVMPFAQGADQFTIQAYSQAVSLDPVDPDLRISLGGVYYALGRYDEAVNSFQLATLAKPDLANAHYNLAAAYREKGDYEKALAEMNITLTLVKKDSEDYTAVKTAIEELNKKKPASGEASPSGELTPPQPAPEAAITPPLELPEDATPPATPLP